MSKKLISFISLGLVALIAVIITIMYLIPVNYSPKINNPDSIIVYESKTSNVGTFQEKNESSQENYRKILTEFNNSFTRNYLSALFAGQTSGAINQTKNGFLYYESPTSSMDRYLIFTYTEPQTLVINNVEQEKTFTKIYMEIKSSNSYVLTSLYFQVSDASNYLLLQTYANQNNLYNLITDLSIVG